MIKRIILWLDYTLIVPRGVEDKWLAHLLETSVPKVYTLLVTSFVEGRYETPKSLQKG